MKSRRNKRLNRICCHQFEDRIAFYSKWQVPVRGSVGLPAAWRSAVLASECPWLSSAEWCALDRVEDSPPSRRVRAHAHPVAPGAQQAGEPEGGAALALPASAKRTGALERTPVSASEFGVKRRP
jgi:hypothetical protein